MSKHNPYAPFVRPLTQADCERGFCNFERVEKGYVSDVEKCKTCGRTVHYPRDMDNNAAWAKDHKLDLLQPYGDMKKDFIYYYGEVQAVNRESD